MTRTARLVGDGLENPANAKALLDAATMFGVPCLFRDSRGLADQWSVHRGGQRLTIVDTVDLLEQLTPLVAVENTPGAASVFTAGLPQAGRRSWSATSVAGYDLTCCVPPPDACRSRCQAAV